jgi:hypothetical protein
MGWKKFKSLTDMWVKKSSYHSGIELSPSKPQLYPRTYETHDVDLEESADTWMLPELTPQEANLLLVMYRNGESDLTNSGAISKSELAACGQEEALRSLVKRGLVEIDTGWGIDEPRHHWLYMGRNLNEKMFDRLMWRYEQESAFIGLMGCIEDYRGNPVDAGEITESAKTFLTSVGRWNKYTDEVIIRDSLWSEVSKLIDLKGYEYGKASDDLIQQVEDAKIFLEDWLEYEIKEQEKNIRDSAETRCDCCGVKDHINRNQGEVEGLTKLRHRKGLLQFCHIEDTDGEWGWYCHDCLTIYETDKQRFWGKVCITKYGEASDDLIQEEKIRDSALYRKDCPISLPNFLGYVCTYRYLVNGQFVNIAIDQAGVSESRHDWSSRTWEFFNADTGTHLNDGVVWHVDDDPLPTYDEVYECIVKPNKDNIRDSTYEYLDKRTRRPSDGLPTWSEILNLAPLTFRDDGLSDALKMVYRIEKAGHGDSVERYLLELLIDERYNRLELIGKAFDISLIHPHNRIYSYQGWETWPCQSLAIRDSAQYVDITRDEFEDFIVDAQGFVCIDPSEYKEKRIGQFCRECVYEYPLTEEGRQIGSIRIYSSIPASNPFVMKQGQSKSRGKGKDAIRCLIVNEQGWPTKKFSHTKRVKNWRLNLMRKYEPTLTESEGHVQ